MCLSHDIIHAIMSAICVLSRVRDFLLAFTDDQRRMLSMGLLFRQPSLPATEEALVLSVTVLV